MKARAAADAVFRLGIALVLLGGCERLVGIHNRSSAPTDGGGGIGGQTVDAGSGGGTGKGGSSAVAGNGGGGSGGTSAGGRGGGGAGSGGAGTGGAGTAGTGGTGTARGGSGGAGTGGQSGTGGTGTARGGSGGAGAAGTGGQSGTGGTSTARGGSGGGGTGGTGGTGGQSGRGGTGTGGGGSGGSGGMAGASGLLIYEPFDYPAGLLDNPTGSNAGGMGLLGKSIGNDARVFGSDITFASGSLTLVTTGRSVFLPSATYASSTRDIDVAMIPADLRDTTGKVGVTGGEIWMSMLAFADQMPVLDSNGQSAGLSLDDTDATTNDHERRYVGFPWFIDADGYRFATWGVGVDGFTGAGHSAVPVTTKSLLVVRFEFGASPTATANTMLWVNPDLSQRLNLGAPDTQIGSTPFRFNRIRFHNWLSPMHFDEIQIGRTYESVVPVR